MILRDEELIVYLGMRKSFITVNYNNIIKGGVTVFVWSTRDWLAVDVELDRNYQEDEILGNILIQERSVSVPFWKEGQEEGIVKSTWLQPKDNTLKHKRGREGSFWRTVPANVVSIDVIYIYCWLWVYYSVVFVWRTRRKKKKCERLC